VLFRSVEFEGHEQVLSIAVNAYAHRATQNVIVRALFPIATDFYRGHIKEFNDAVTKVLGYDGVVQRFEGGNRHYVAFRPDQIKIVGRRTVKKTSETDFDIKIVAAVANAKSINENDYEDVADEYFDKNQTLLTEIAESFINHKNRKNKWLVPWPLISAARLSKIWTDFSRSGVVRDVRGMQDIADKMFEGVVRLKASNDISGHSTNDVRPELADSGYKFTDKQWHRLIEGLEDKKGNWYISDYGWPKLEKLLIPLKMAKTAEEQLLIVDQMLNICHPRGDLSAMFVEGGRKTLDKLFLDGTEKTASVKNWFGSSKVVDENGAPLVVYHGSRNPMTESFSHDYEGTGEIGRAHV
jgi:hypothetical protein